VRACVCVGEEKEEGGGHVHRSKS